MKTNPVITAAQFRAMCKASRKPSKRPVSFMAAWDFYLSTNFDMPVRMMLRPASEVRFIPNRKFRFDFAWLDIKLALEIDGGLYRMQNTGKPGAHSSIAGMERDREKDWLASQAGWQVIRWTPKMITTDNMQRLLLMIHDRL